MADKVSKKNPIQARREEEKEERRQDIIDAAEKVMAKKGWSETNYGDVAKQARLSRSLVYFYFPERSDLFHAVCERGLQVLQKRFAKAIAANRTGLEQIIAIGRAYYEFSYEEPLYFGCIAQFQTEEFDPECQDPDEEMAHDQGRAVLGQVAQALTTGLADRSIRANIGDPALSAISIWAFTHGLIQIATHKEPMLQQLFGVSAKQTMDHGFALLNGSLAAG
jgi:AcrR family transcriptional regulator